MKKNVNDKVQWSYQKNEVYNPKHNDRQFKAENSEHIDADRTVQNVYWDCFQGFRTDHDETLDSFDDVERKFYRVFCKLYFSDFETQSKKKIDFINYLVYGKGNKIYNLRQGGKDRFTMGKFKMEELEEEMGTEEMQRFLNIEADRGTSELEAYRNLMYILGIEFSGNE